MAHITSRKHPVSHRKSPSASGRLTAATLFTGLALALPVTAAELAVPADAQVATAKNLPGVKVEATTGKPGLSALDLDMLEKVEGELIRLTGGRDE